MVYLPPPFWTLGLLVPTPRAVLTELYCFRRCSENGSASDGVGRSEKASENTLESRNSRSPRFLSNAGHSAPRKRVFLRSDLWLALHDFLSIFRRRLQYPIYPTSGRVVFHCSPVLQYYTTRSRGRFLFVEKGGYDNVKLWRRPSRRRLRRGTLTLGLLCDVWAVVWAVMAANLAPMCLGTWPTGLCFYNSNSHRKKLGQSQVSIDQLLT